MKKIILVICTVLFLSGCQTSSLGINKSEELVLKYNVDKLKLSSDAKIVKSLNFKDLFVDQYILKDEHGRVLFYEDARTDMNYEFNFKDLHTLLLIFGDINRYEMVYHRNNLTFVQLFLKNNTRVNVILQANSDQIISYVYGFSNHEFIKLAKEINVDSKEKVEVKRLKLQSQTLVESQEPLTQWNDKMVFFAPLITPVRGMGRL